jgi:hypothetical protein
VNRRTLFETGQIMLRICGYEIKMTEEEAMEFKNNLRPMKFRAVYELIQESAKRIS